MKGDNKLYERNEDYLETFKHVNTYMTKHLKENHDVDRGESTFDMLTEKGV